MKKILTSSAMFVAVALIATSMAQAAGKTVPVKFAKGATSATIKSQIKGDAYVDYTIKAGAGQTLAVNLKGTSLQTYFNVIPSGAEEALFIGSTSGNSLKKLLPDDGVYKIRVYLMRAAARRGTTSKYSLTVALTGKALQPIKASVDALVPGTRFHAKATVSCSLDLHAEIKECEAFVVRRGIDGTATVELRAGGVVRRILFVKGKAVSSDSAQNLVVSRIEDLSVVSFGGSEKYSIPDPLIFGG